MKWMSNYFLSLVIMVMSFLSPTAFGYNVTFDSEVGLTNTKDRFVTLFSDLGFDVRDNGENVTLNNLRVDIQPITDTKTSISIKNVSPYFGHNLSQIYSYDQLKLDPNYRNKKTFAGFALRYFFSSSWGTHFIAKDSIKHYQPSGTFFIDFQDIYLYGLSPFFFKDVEYFDQRHLTSIVAVRLIFLASISFFDHTIKDSISVDNNAYQIGYKLNL
jgi:hypothetical protein